jgi:hypothetical protein
VGGGGGGGRHRLGDFVRVKVKRFGNCEGYQYAPPADPLVQVWRFFRCVRERV